MNHFQWQFPLVCDFHGLSMFLWWHVVWDLGIVVGVIWIKWVVGRMAKGIRFVGYLLDDRLSWWALNNVK
jgi:hypothetical protein